ncbi:MAG: (Fe-S)-binding protein, partial [Oscillospiraceae bacterium]
ASHKDFSVNRPLAEAISKDFPYEGVHKQMPGSLAIKEILAKMGKTLPEQELNCGSCGYNTCREKAIAVLMGKADLSMCLPYLKEKAESFSDKIINNTPNGIFVLNEKLEIQQMNSAAGKIFNIKNTCEAVGKPVVDILDPTDYLLTMTGIPNVYEKKRFLTEYEKYVEETIIFDRDYHIIMSIMKDVTDEEHIREKKDIHSQRAIEITDRVVEKQMRIVQEIASLLGETTAETKIALTKLKETLTDE